MPLNQATAGFLAQLAEGRMTPAQETTPAGASGERRRPGG